MNSDKYAQLLLWTKFSNLLTFSNCGLPDTQVSSQTLLGKKFLLLLLPTQCFQLYPSALLCFTLQGCLSIYSSTPAWRHISPSTPSEAFRESGEFCINSYSFSLQIQPPEPQGDCKSTKNEGLSGEQVIAFIPENIIKGSSREIYIYTFIISPLFPVLSLAAGGWPIKGVLPFLEGALYNHQKNSTLCRAVLSCVWLPVEHVV